MTTTPLQAAYKEFCDAARTADELARIARNAVADAKAAAEAVTAASYIYAAAYHAAEVNA